MVDTDSGPAKDVYVNNYKTAGKDVESIEFLYSDKELLHPPTELLETCDKNFQLVSQEFGKDLRDKGRYNDALTLFERLSQRQKTKYGDEDIFYLRTLFEIAVTYMQMFEYERAEPILDELLATRERVLGTEHNHTLNAMSALGDIYERKGKLDEAEKIHLKILDIRTRQDGPEYYKCALQLNSLGMINARQGHDEESLDLYLRALAGLEKAFEYDHLDILATLNNLAGAYDRLGREKEAEQTHKRILTIRVQSWGSEHPVTLQAMKQFATFYLAHEHHTQARVLFERIFVAREKSYGPHDTRTLHALFDAASSCASCGDYQRAADLAELLIQRRQSLPNPPNTRTEDAKEAHLHLLDAQELLANAYEDLQRYTEAESLLRSTITAFTSLKGADSFAVLAGRYRLCSTIRNQERTIEAETAYKSLLADCERALGYNAGLTVQVLLSIVSMISSRPGSDSNAQEALALSQSALERAEVSLGPDSLNTVRAALHVALGYQMQCNYIDSLPLMERVLAVREKKMGKWHYNTLVSAQGVALCALMLGDVERALGLYEWAAEGLGRLGLKDERRGEVWEATDSVLVCLYRLGRVEECRKRMKGFCEMGVHFRVEESDGRVNGGKGADGLGGGHGFVECCELGDGDGWWRGLSADFQQGREMGRVARGKL